MQKLNKLYCGDAVQVLSGFDSDSIDLTVTSPPYNVGKNYDSSNDNLTAENYFAIISNVLEEVYRVTKTGGRLCLNVPFIGNSYFLGKSECMQFYPSPYVELCQDLNWIFRDFVVWVKSSESENPNNFSGNSTQWRSWQSASCPFLRCYAEVILIFHKQSKTLQHNGVSDITKEEFLEYTKNVWYFPASYTKCHPAIFPIELPRRCIKLYSYVDDIVLDPFSGIGSTCVAANNLQRRWIGIDVSMKYTNIARAKLAQLRLF